LEQKNKRTSVSMNDKPQIPNPELIDRIAMMIGSMRDVPEGFEESFREWAPNWNRNYKSPDAYRQWSIEIRPYSVVELAKQPGMPKRTKLQELLKELPIPKKRRRNASGKLTPEVVQMLLERLAVSHSKEKTMSELDDSEESVGSDEVSITEQLAKIGIK
jgi:hypothetical protein